MKKPFISKEDLEERYGATEYQKSVMNLNEAWMNFCEMLWEQLQEFLMPITNSIIKALHLFSGKGEPQNRKLSQKKRLQKKVAKLEKQNKIYKDLILKILN